MSTIKIAEPARELFTLEEARAFLKCDDAEADSVITLALAAARELAEKEMARTLLETGYEMRTDGFSRAVRLEWPRVQRVLSLQFVAPDGEVLTLDPQDYVLDNANDFAPAWLVPARGKAWPETADEVNAVRVRYVAGYGTEPAQVPAAIRQWVQLHARSFYDNPSALSAGNLQALPYLCGLIEGFKVYG
ncbi:head-tail connector protein [Azohydromonas aeria]|uniref:head-tail connector protein n=1 Tax=Azohydromonas aeria TaxID=2590212 RepID=UPI0012FCDB80|nr:hypothetical protein [Azohydromonas aeria]